MSTVACHDCGQQVRDLRQHRSQCPNSRRNRSSVARAGQSSAIAARSTVECYDCHQHVESLADHRSQGCSARPASASLAPPSRTLITGTTDFYALLDVSGSMAGTKLESAKQTMSDFFPTMSRTDRAAVVTFDAEAFFKIKPRAIGQLLDQQELTPLLARIKAGGTTALYDAIYLVMEQVRDKSRRTVIVVLTDGEDNSSRRSLREVLALLQEYPNLSLHIVHVDERGTRVAAFEELCAGRGGYHLTTTPHLIEETGRVYRLAYHQE